MNKVTKEQVLANIKNTTFFNTEKTAICVLTLENGFEIVGTYSVVNKSNFELGTSKSIAYDKAVANIWEFLGFSLQQQLHDQEEK